MANAIDQFSTMGQLELDFTRALTSTVAYLAHCWQVGLVFTQTTNDNSCRNIFLSRVLPASLLPWFKIPAAVRSQTQVRSVVRHWHHSPNQSHSYKSSALGRIRLIFALAEPKAGKKKAVNSYCHFLEIRIPPFIPFSPLLHHHLLITTTTRDHE